MVDDSLWIKSRSGNPTIRTSPFEGDNIKYKGDFFDWYRVFELEYGIIAISEPWHAQGVFAYMIFGENKVMLLDTGMGIVNIRPLVELFLPSDKELVVVNTHTHFDHIGSNCYFDKVFIYNHPVAISRAKMGYSHRELLPEITESQFYREYPKDYIAEKFEILGFNYECYEDGAVFDLGGRQLKAIHSPGHSKDSVMFYDETNQLLFTGDSYYPGRLFLINTDSQIKEYANSIGRACSYADKTKRLIPSHNYPQDDPKILQVVFNAMNELSSGIYTLGREVPDLGNNYEAFDYNGCTIVMTKH